MQTYTVTTEYQDGPHEIRVLLPDIYRQGKPYRVLYVLPVEPECGRRFGRPLDILQQTNAHNRYDLIAVEMGFEKEPWYGDHATDLKTRQASYIKDFVVPFIEERHSTLGTPEGRLLLGFSKSGWGAFSLILKHPEFFGYAASWDAPLLLTGFILAMESVYGTPGQLALYRPDLLIPLRKQFFQEKPRLVLTGETGWGKSVPTQTGGSHTVDTHALLEKEGIPHYYNGNLPVEHRWDAAWVEPVLKALMELASGPAASH